MRAMRTARRLGAVWVGVIALAAVVALAGCDLGDDDGAQPGAGGEPSTVDDENRDPVARYRSRAGRACDELRALVASAPEPSDERAALARYAGDATAIAGAVLTRLNEQRPPADVREQVGALSRRLAAAVRSYSEIAAELEARRGGLATSEARERIEALEERLKQAAEDAELESCAPPWR